MTILVFLALLIFPSLLATSLGEIQSFTQISTFGVISYPNSQPSKLSSGTLPLTGVGGDYLLFFDNGSPDRWLSWNSYWLNQVAALKTKGYTTVRLSFWFSGATSNPNDQGISVLDYTKFDTVLGYLDGINVKIVALCQNWGDLYGSEGYGYTMSQHLWNNWLDFVNHYKGDRRIAAVSLFGETDGHSIGVSTLTPASRLAQTEYYTELTKAIHQIDPDRVVVFPLGELYYSSQTSWIADLQVTGITNEPNVVFDITHPYFFENDYDMGLNPEKKAAWYADNLIIPAVNILGANRCWMGETFAWYPGNSYETPVTPSHPMHVDLQQRFLTAIINKCVSYGVGFDVWAVIGQDSYSYNIQAMDNSNYARLIGAT